VRTVAPEVKAVKQPIQFLDAQYDSLVGGLRRGFEPFGFKAFEPKAEAVALPIKDFHSGAMAIQKNKKDGVEYRHFNIQFDESGEAVDGFSEVYGLGVEVDFFDFGVGTHHRILAPEKNREDSIGDQF
jgi:hypothetical protein